MKKMIIILICLVFIKIYINIIKTININLKKNNFYLLIKKSKLINNF